MKIIKRGKDPNKKKYKVTCDNCKTIFEFLYCEAKYNADDRDGDYLSIKCPVCKEEIITKP